MRILVNGEARTVRPLSDLSYTRLCSLAGKAPIAKPVITYTLPDGRTGKVPPGCRAPLVEGATYTVECK